MGSEPSGESRVVQVRSPDGTLLGCEVGGAGPPLLLVHGSTADRNRWAAVRPALAARFTLWLMDRRGRGLSLEQAASGAEYALAREAEDVAAVVGSIGDGAHVLAHSYGGACVLEAAARGAPIGRMLVYEPAFGTEAGPVFPVAALSAVEQALARGDREAALRTFFADVLLLGEDQISAMRGTEAWRARVACVDTLPREARAANAYRVRGGGGAVLGASVRFLLGTETAPPLVASTRAGAAAWAGSSLRELTGHGHAAMDADPEMFAAEVVKWLG
jgi:pimeloyl-ACP methyl ester carboxylesterase